ncbi:MAG: IS701 family transposase [Prochloraceae cyanobacterium]|nr:IS701 family transposase [Prochloraceae cyanobacterium]
MVEPRPPVSTVQFIDSYCELYQNLFKEVRSFENFKYLHLGIISNIKRKTLPAIAKVVGLDNEQSLHHFLTQSPWSAEELRKRRLEIILKVLQERSIILIIDETGDKKKGKSTDYVKRQYIGNIGKIESGIVVVTAYGYLDGITFPLTFEVFKPKGTLKEGDRYKTKPEIAGKMIQELLELCFKFELVLADSLYGESDVNFISILSKFKLNYLVAIRSNHGIWLPKGQNVRHNKWRKFERIFSNKETETRYIREIIFGKRRPRQYWQITTDSETLPDSSTWYVMSNIPGVKYNEVGNLYGLRTWVEYGLKQSKNELGWADFRVTNYGVIEKWWEIVMSSYLMVSLHSDRINSSLSSVPEKFKQHQLWDSDRGWKNVLNNLYLIVQPFICFNLIKLWLKVFPIPQLSLGFPRLISIMNLFDICNFTDDFFDRCYRSTA